VLVVALASGCGGGGALDGTDGRADTRSVAPADDGQAVQEAARGQTVRWWMFGGDERINGYVRDHVIPAAEGAGVTLEQVSIDDTGAVVQRVISEREAGRDSGGAVDLIWINGENFALGKQLGLWREDWARALPSARFLDPEDPTLAFDFGVEVEGQEAPWSRAALVFARDTRRVGTPPASVEELLAYARANPGRVAYPAPPDFTGSAFLRLAVQEMGEDEALEALRAARPFLHRQGRALPKNEAELSRLFGDGEVDFAMSYDPSFVMSGVRRGTFPRWARPFAMDRTLINVSYVTIPANASSPEGALVVADLLLSPGLQAVKADPEVLGVPTVLDLGRLSPADRALFETARQSPYLLGPGSLGSPLTELPASEVPRLDERYRREVLR
jgi:putative spermidine/putrescine transport system substrate-binding protein